MTDSLSDIRARLHRKSHDYFTFEYSHRERTSWRMFYGATDALLDASMAARAFGQAVRGELAVDLLVCYGFLQALYIQQDLSGRFRARLASNGIQPMIPC